MAKRAFLIHGWEGYPEEGWRPFSKALNIFSIVGIINLKIRKYEKDNFFFIKTIRQNVR